MKNVTVTKQNVKTGDKVIKGKDWCWGSQDGNSKFGVTKVIKDRSWVSVSWENGQQNTYRIGDEGCFDLYFYTKELTPSLINRIGHLL